MNTLERKLPIGIQTFEDIRRGNYLYVDKTSILWQIINTGSLIFLVVPVVLAKVCLFLLLKPIFRS